MNVNTKHKDFLKREGQWKTIEDVTTLENLTGYLRMLNPQDDSPANKIRNQHYQSGAVFYPVAQQTAQGMLGSIFRKWPTLNVPKELEYLAENADGGGNSIYQSSQGACDDVMRKGRAGITVTFPQTSGQVSRADILSGRIVATIHRFAPEQIINWRVGRDGAKAILTLVVTREELETPGADGYTSQPETIYREMYLDIERDDDGSITSKVYRERIWIETADKALTLKAGYTPLDAAGKTWGFIPFQFIGSENNDPKTDMPPFLGMCLMNLGHYRNSADYEDSVWYNGQAQAWMSGVDQGHIDMMKENKMYVGSRELLAVPSGETFGFSQPLPNTLVKEAMDSKINAMIQMGARLMQVGSATKTATQASSDQEAQTSLLAMVASNVSEAYTQAIKWACMYMGADDKEVAYTLSQEFVSLSNDPQEVQQIVAGFIQGAIPVGDYTRYMRKRELFSDDVSDEDYADLLARNAV
jgi:hypothetical protein